MAGRPDGIMFPKAEGGASLIAPRRQDHGARGAARPPGRSYAHPRVDHRDRQGAVSRRYLRGRERAPRSASPGAPRTSPPSSAPRPTAMPTGISSTPTGSRAACALPPRPPPRSQAIDTVYVDFRNADGLRRETEEARRDGFTAKMAIHPAQVEVINEVFTPTRGGDREGAGDRCGLCGRSRRRRGRHRRRHVRPPAPGARAAADRAGERQRGWRIRST